jgi:hypothetical protein
MIRYACPQCEQIIESSQDLAGLKTHCPHCRLNVEVPLASTAPPKKRRTEILALQEQASEPVRKPTTLTVPPPAKPGPCLCCTDPQAFVSPCCLRLGKRSMFIYLKCSCCDACRARFAGAHRYRIGGIVVMFSFLLFSFFVGIPLSVFLGQISPWLAVAVIAIPLLGFFLTPLFQHFGLKRRYAEILPPQTDALLKQLVEVRSWGFGTFIGMLKEVPANQPYVEVRPP